MPDENLHIFNDPNLHVNRAQWYNEIYQAYSWHFKIKEPSKKEIVDFFLDQKITF